LRLYLIQIHDNFSRYLTFALPASFFSIVACSSDIALFMGIRGLPSADGNWWIAQPEKHIADMIIMVLYMFIQKSMITIMKTII